MNDPSKLMNQSQMMNQPLPMMMNHQQHVMNQNPQILINRGNYGMWPPVEQLNFPNPKFPAYVSSSKRNNWKGKNSKKGNDKRRIENPSLGGGGGGGSSSNTVNYKPPTLKELQHQNRLKAKRYFPKKKFNNRSAPFAPRNTTSFIIRAKKSGGIASLVSPCPVTPAVLPTPIFSPSREALVDTAKEEWGVDGYGSMKGLIRLRSPGNEDEEEEEGGSSESDVEEHLEVERRLDHDLSRFEMIYPNYGVEYNNILENRVDDQDTHIAQVEEENLILKERLFLMERELGDLRRRLICLERQSQVGEEVNEEVVENESDNESESHSRGYSRSMEENNEEVYMEDKEDADVEVKNANKVERPNKNMEEDNEGDRGLEAKEENHDGEVELKMVNKVEAPNTVGAGDVCMEENNEGEAKEEANCEEVEVKNENKVETPRTEVCMEENKEGNCSLEAKEENNNENIETKNADKVESPKTIVGDVCREELEHAQNEVIAGNQCKEDGAGDEC